jgi:hypothetical protein
MQIWELFTGGAGQDRSHKSHEVCARRTGQRWCQPWMFYLGLMRPCLAPWGGHLSERTRRELGPLSSAQEAWGKGLALDGWVCWAPSSPHRHCSISLV